MKLRENVDLIAVVLLALLFGAGGLPKIQERVARFAAEQSGKPMWVISVATVAHQLPSCWR